MLFYNEDWIHFLWTRYNAKVEVTEQSLKEYIYSFKDTQVTDFLMNVNGTVSTAPSKVFETFADKYVAKSENGIPVDFTDTFAKTAYRLINEEHVDMYRIWIDTSKEIGINPWISIRVNDCHDNWEPTDFRKSSFVDSDSSHYISSHRKPTGYFDKCLDYSLERIRNRMLDYIAEMVERYDAYGIELDLMRDFIFTKPGYEAEFKRFLYAALDIIEQVGKKRNKRIKISLLLPSSPQFCLERGVDITELQDRIDYAVIISRWETTDTDMPIELWKRLLRETDIKLGAGQQLLFKPYRNYKPVITPLKMAFGQAASNLDRGCDFVYLYNYMDFAEYEGELADWVYEGSIREDAARPFMLSNIASEETLLKQPRSHTVTYADFNDYFISANSRLPITFGKKYEYQLIKIPVGKLPQNAKKRLVLGINCDRKIEANMLNAYVNSEKCEFVSVEKILDRIYEHDCYVFDIKSDCSGIAYAEIMIEHDCVVEYAEIEIIPH